MYFVSHNDVLFLHILYLFISQTDIRFNNDFWPSDDWKTFSVNPAVYGCLSDQGRLRQRKERGEVRLSHAVALLYLLYCCFTSTVNI